MASGLDRSKGSKYSLRILPFSAVLLPGPFFPIVKSLLPYWGRWGGHGTHCSRLMLASEESLEETDRHRLPYFSIFNIDKSQEKSLMGPAWISVTPWTSHCIQGDRVLLQAAYS